MPFVRGREPTSSAMLVPSKASSGRSCRSRPASSGKAQSTSSIATPSSAPIAGGISSRRRSTGWSGPSSCPLAMRNTRL